MVFVIMMSSFSNSNVPSCMESLITNPFVKLSLIYFVVYFVSSNHSTSLIISVLIYLILDKNNVEIKPIDENIPAEMTLQNEITELEKEVQNKDEIAKEIEKIESDLENQDVVEEESNNIEDSNIIEEESKDTVVDQEIKEVINIKSSRGMKDNCEECSFLKNSDYNIQTNDDLVGYDTNEYYNIN